jgi:aminoglycoside 6'-N-acetyltransferase
MTYRFRTIKAEDFPQILIWLQRPHVKRWWDDGDDTLEKVVHHYGSQEEGVARFILTEIHPFSERAIGYFQYYQVNDETFGIDQFIGEPDYLNRGVGTETIALFIQLIRAQFGAVSIVLDPLPENNQAIRCYEKVGFQYFETRNDPEKPGNLAYMMRLL